MSHSHYDVLGVSSDASPEEIREAYVNLAPLCHPNVVVYDMANFPIGTLSHEECWKAVSIAYAVVADSKQRSCYNEGLQTVLPNEQEMLDQYEAIIGPTNVSEAVVETSTVPVPRASPLKVLVLYYVLNLEDYFYGGWNTIEYNRQVIVNDCISISKNSVSFAVLPGKTHPGGWFMFPNQGDQISAGEECGMLQVFLWLNPHPKFTWSGADLHMNYYVSLTTALTGGRVKLNGIDGKMIILDFTEPFPAHLPLVRRIIGEGMPCADGRGDLIIFFYVHLPYIPIATHEHVCFVVKHFDNRQN